jgi:hypothetical protein
MHKSALDLKQDEMFRRMGIKEDVTVETIREWRKQNPKPESEISINYFAARGLKVVQREEAERLIKLGYMTIGKWASGR